MNKLLGLILVVVLGLAPAGARGQTCETWYPGGEEFPGLGGHVTFSGGGSVHGMTLWDPDGTGPARSKVIACGTFGAAGTSAADRIAMWNGTTWTAVGLAANYTQNGPTRVVVYNNEVVVSGDLGVVGLPTHYIARWTGTSWQPLGSGINANATAMIVYNGELVVGGGFTTAGGIPVTGIARWNGSTWQTLGTGFSVGGYALQLTEYNGDLIAGGVFTSAGGVSATSIARWNGSTWSSMNNTNSQNRGPFGILDGSLYSGGPAGVFRYTGTGWQQIASALASGSIEAMTGYAGELYVGGSFNAINSVSAFRIARWNSTNGWRRVGPDSGFSGASIRSLLVRENELIAGGDMSVFAGVANTRGVARWNGTSWLSTSEEADVGSGIGSIGIYNGQLVAIGTFSRLGGASVSNLAIFEGGEWKPLGPPGLSVPAQHVNPLAFLEHEGDLFMTGVWSLSGVSHQGVSRWNGATLVPVGDAMNSSATARALVMHNGDLIAGGAFTAIGGVTMNRIARWNGTSWQPMGTGMNGEVHALAVYNGQLYAGGAFTTAGGVTANRIARWDGSTWHPLTTGTNITVSSLVVFGGNLIVGGNFTSAGGVSTPAGVAAWNGSNWTSMGTTGASTTSGLRIWKGQLIAAGVFSGFSVGTQLARWNGSSWVPFTGMTDSTRWIVDGDRIVTASGSFIGGGVNVYSPVWAVYGEVPTTPPSLAVPPHGQEVGSGSTLTLHAFAAAGIPGLRYQWYRNGVALINGWDGAAPGGGFVTKSKGVVHDANRPILLVIKDCQPADAGMYHLRLTSPCGLSTDSPAVTVTILGDETCTPGCLP